MYVFILRRDGVLVDQCTLTPLITQPQIPRRP